MSPDDLVQDGQPVSHLTFLISPFSENSTYLDEPTTSSFSTFPEDNPLNHHTNPWLQHQPNQLSTIRADGNLPMLRNYHILPQGSESSEVNGFVDQENVYSTSMAGSTLQTTNPRRANFSGSLPLQPLNGTQHRASSGRNPGSEGCCQKRLHDPDPAPCATAAASLADALSAVEEERMFADFKAGKYKNAFLKGDLTQSIDCFHLFVCNFRLTRISHRSGSCVLPGQQGYDSAEVKGRERGPGYS
jgi:hypothetical protein